MSGYMTRRAPGTAFAVATPPLGLTSGSTSPCTTRVGTRIRLELSIEQFRLAVLWALLLTGLYTFASRLV